MKNLSLKNKQLAFAILVACAGQASAADYWFKTFSLPADGVASARAINDAGLALVTIIGGGQGGSEQVTTYQATTWNGAAYTYLDNAGQTYSSAGHINNQGTITGWTGNWTYELDWGRVLATKQVIWTAGTATVLPQLGATVSHYYSDSLYFGSSVGGINNAGVIVGGSSTSDGVHAVKWVNNTLIDMGKAGGTDAAATAINENGAIVGAAKSTSGHSTAILWENGNVIDLGAQAGFTTNSGTYDINNSGTILGWQQALTGYNRIPTIWQNGVATQLATLGYGDAGASAINDAGAVVGYSLAANGAYHAVMWSNGKVIDLNDYLDPGLRADGWVMTSSSDINNRGDIVGNMVNSRLGKSTAYMLTVATVPEPETYAMMLSGVGLLAFVARRRKGRRS
ncbi:PEP-CTERM sorting domain-containing protein [Rugamonas sp. FT107W]|uniref:PEP-CTERM sorting domain-containing protein n=1 Tax=Duganella vulcania TaxID=2692166 RepID=A0A845HPI7_9BURK|nr:PEP-CTERM sorting domain-containing protein [Duganella vulcania]MYN18784.1 PEP-CTERM sorting domain-containing protein [Duganella vulcania]